MRLNLLVICLFFGANSIIAQTIYLRVLGEYQYSEYAKSKGMIVTFDVSSKSVEEEKKRFLNTTIDAGLKIKLIPAFNDSFSIRNKNKFRIEIENAILFDELLDIVREEHLRIEKLYYPIPEHVFEDEDEKALFALDNARERADIIAKNLNYKVVEVLNIDDDTTRSSVIFDVIEKDSRLGNLIDGLLEKTSALIQTNYSSTPVPNGGYYLWVTFKLKPK